MNTCAIDGCQKPTRSRTAQWCEMHYHRWYNTGDPGEAAPRSRKHRNAECAVDGCTKPDKETGLCSMHGVRLRRHGDAHKVIQPSERAVRVGPEHQNWVGESASYNTAHARVRAQKGSASAHQCVNCTKPAKHWSYDNTDPEEKVTPEGYRYSLNAERYEPRCVQCHSDFDKAAR